MLENTSENKVFVNVVDGKFTVRVDQTTPNAKPRTNKNNKVVYELQYDSITGHLVNIYDQVVDNEYGSFRTITFIVADADETYYINMPYSSRESKGILMRLPNANLLHAISIKIARKDHVFTWIQQQGVTIPLKWTKDQPGDLPQMVEIEAKGVKTWDDNEQMKYLVSYIQANVVAKIPSRSKDQGFNSPALPPPDLMNNDLPY